MIYDTIAAIATPLTPSGIGIIRVSGEESIKIVDKIFKSHKENKCLLNVGSHTINYGNIIDLDGTSIIDEVLVSVMKSPNTYTKENVVEINCHGGIIIMEKILKLVLELGARLAEPGEFTKRAFLNGRIDLSQAEAVIDIINAKTDLVAKSSLNQLKGKLSKEINIVKNLLLELIAYIEASIDYPEYEIEDFSSDILMSKLIEIKNILNRLVDSYDNGKIIKEGIKTVIIGKPNVGKSSLLNALLKEQRAIVTDIPGTTRDILEEYMNIHGVPIKIVDTAGIRDTKDFVEKIGVERSKQMIKEADLIILMIDSSCDLTNEDTEILNLIEDEKIIILLNKIDLDQKVNKEDLIKYTHESNIIPISVKNSDGIENLENAIKKMFIKGDITFNDSVYITNIRHKSALDLALKSVIEVETSINSGFAEDFWTIDLKNAYDAVGEITGDSIQEDLVGQIFSMFCLGK